MTGIPVPALQYPGVLHLEDRTVLHNEIEGVLACGVELGVPDGFTRNKSRTVPVDVSEGGLHSILVIYP